MPEQSPESVPNAVKPFYAEIVRLTDAVCRQHLNEEYAEMARKLAATLARKRPSPILRGRPEIWACAIVYALGTVNFLFDPTQTPHLSVKELCAAFGVKQSSATSKARTIREMLEMFPFDPRWCLPSKLDENPLVWQVMVNGLVVDIRRMPREIQELAYAKGLIPYIPADRKKE